MKTTHDLEFRPGIAAPTTLSNNGLRRSANLAIEVLQANRLWRLFPIQPQSRLLPPAKIRIGDATADFAQLEQWACELPGCNWGLATGAASGVFVLEVATGIASSALRSLCEDEWDWQQTLLMSAGDAAYAFFRWPAGRAMRRSCKNPAPGVRIRAEGDCVLVPPSVGISGVPYIYLDSDAAIAPAPQWLIHSAFTGVEEQSSGKVLVFPKSISQKVSITARPPGLSYAKLLPFVAHASILPDPNARHRVYMSFQLHSSRWSCQFMENDLQVLLPRTLNLATVEELVAFVNRGSGLSNQEGRQALDLAIATKRGGVFLSLTTDQYSKLQMHSRPAGTRSNAGEFSFPAGPQGTTRMFD